MISDIFEPELIRKLNEVGKQLQDVSVKIPPIDEQERAKAVIEQILPPEEGYVTMGYVRNVLTGLEYAETHFRKSSMLDDIKENRWQQYDISEYQSL